MTNDPIQMITAARKVADYASEVGLSLNGRAKRQSYKHLGAVLADSVLQAGLNYATVVRPRIDRILICYPEAITISAISRLVKQGQVEDFLSWKHHEKVARFTFLVMALDGAGVSSAESLRESLVDENFATGLQQIRGIGPKTVDYMSCLLGIESVAVDRHIRSFAKRAGLEASDYGYLKRVFCSAADLLSVSRRDFDSWIWQRESERSRQLAFNL
jgi:hypothetical protein